MNALEQNIMEALAGNPRVHPDEISVEAFDGDVILRGTVGSVVQRQEAVRTTRHVTGVSHRFTYPKVTEIRRVSLQIAGPPDAAGPGRVAACLRCERR